MKYDIKNHLAENINRTWYERTANMRLRLRMLIGRYPSVYYTVYSGRIKNPVTDRSVLCIEGYMSSANSFMTYLFLCANKVQVGHHQHVIAQIKRAQKYKLPIVVTVRDPMNMATSFLSRKPFYKAEVILDGYIDFYTAALNITKGNLIVAQFETVTNNPNKVIIEINRRYGTSFNRVDDIATASDKYFSHSSSYTKPSRGREELKKTIRFRVSNAVNLKQAYSVYNRLLSLESAV